MHEGSPHTAPRSPQGLKPGRRPLGGLSDPADPIEQLTELFLGDLPASTPATEMFDVDDLPLPPLKTEPSRAKPSAPAPADARQARDIASTVRREPVQMRAEVVVIGHLPVAASAWVQQYAKHRQKQVGSPVVLLRWRGESAAIDLFGVAPGAAGLDPLHKPASLSEAILAASSLAETLIVSVDETREIETAMMPGVRRVAILTGSHDTAVVACYRALKGMVHQESIREGHTELAVVVLGGPEERSRDAAARLERTTASFLSHAVACEVVSDKIGPTRPIPLFLGNAVGSPAAFLRSVIAPLQPSKATEPQSTESTVPETGQEAASITPRFSGLRSVDVRCPFAPGVEIAVSPEGEVHVLAMATPERNISQAVADLTACASWVEVNTAVLRGAIPELAKRVGAVKPREHLVTTEPKLVRGLLDSRLRLHLDAAGAIVDLN
jgi:hypothetical protein